MALPVVYHSIEDVVMVLNDNKAQEETVTELLQIYNKTKDRFIETNTSEGKNFPFIVLEGIDGSGKTTIAQLLSEKLRLKPCHTPPSSISHLRPLFENHPTLRTAYYSLGNYIAAMEVGIFQKKSLVIMDRYWHSTCAFAVAQDIQDHPEKLLPQPGDKIYAWPSDLLKPDIAFLLEITEDKRREWQSMRRTNTRQEELLNSSDSFRNNVITAYKNITGSVVVPINAELNYNTEVIPNIIRTINEILKIDIETEQCRTF